MNLEEVDRPNWSRSVWMVCQGESMHEDKWMEVFHALGDVHPTKTLGITGPRIDIPPKVNKLDFLPRNLGLGLIDNSNSILMYIYYIVSY